MYIYESQHHSPIKNHQTSTYQPPLPTQNTGFPILAVAVLCIMATAFLLVSYYIFVTKCCINWQQISPLRRFSIARVRRTEDPLIAYSPSWQSRGLDETLIREIPTYQFSKSRGEETSLSKCVVCLNEFQEEDTLRLLPNCKHAFHLDCIDIWLQNNANCPLCRLSISGATRYPMDRIIAPTSSPQDPQPFISNSRRGSNEDFVVIELGEDGNESRENVVLQSRRHSSSPRKFEQKSLETRKSHPLSSRGDECINAREKDDQFSIEPIRRSFSMDSAVDRHIYSSVQEIICQNGIQIATRNNEECSSRVLRRPFFSFGNGRGSRNAVLPVEL